MGRRAKERKARREAARERAMGAAGAFVEDNSGLGGFIIRPDGWRRAGPATAAEYRRLKDLKVLAEAARASFQAGLDPPTAVVVEEPSGERYAIPVPGYSKPEEPEPLTPAQEAALERYRDQLRPGDMLHTMPDGAVIGIRGADGGIRLPHVPGRPGQIIGSFTVGDLAAVAGGFAFDLPPKMLKTVVAGSVRADDDHPPKFSDGHPIDPAPQNEGE